MFARTSSPTRRLATVAVMTIALLVGPLVTFAAAATKPDDRTIKEAYVYLLGRALVIRQETNDLKEKGIAYNHIKYNPLGSADFVNPNFDVAYLEAWFAVDDQSAVILEVPEIKDRYYTAQILDEWGEVIVNINERSFPSKPFGKFALLKPGAQVKVPNDATPIYLHSSKAKMLARVELKGDPDGAVKLQKAFKASVIGEPSIAKPAPMAAFDNKNLLGAEIFDDVSAVLSSALDVAPNAAEMQGKVRAVAEYMATGKEARSEIDNVLKKVVPEFQEFAFTKSAPYRNHWVGGAQTGNYGKNYWLRTTVDYAGIWGNTGDEVMYFVATRDASEQPLEGSKSYVIHFPADKLPQNAVDSYWSVILVGVPDYRVVPNDLKRYNFNTYSGLKLEADGSLKIGIGPKSVEGVPETNWLPSPEGKPFSLTFRTYVPKDIVKKGEWQPAPVTKAE
ncbi:MAG: DUF1214 domain-containing protein [Shinella sp.]|uniref:DUF1214 domain-containing protein n=1 Tax=Shinella sp. TaxID=1870904 RepID=UPI0040360855